MNKKVNVYYVVSAVLSCLIFLAHSFVGEAAIAQPLLAMNDISDEVKYGLYYCWHITTFALVLLSATYIYCAFHADNIALAVLNTVLAAGIALLGVGMALVAGTSFDDFGQGYFFIPITLFGCIGIYRAKNRVDPRQILKGSDTQLYTG